MQVNWMRVALLLSIGIHVNIYQGIMSYLDTMRIDTVLSKYVIDFISDAKKYGHPDVSSKIEKLSVSFVTLTAKAGKPAHAAQCRTDYVYRPIKSIVVNSTYWASHSEKQRKAMMYHELGHCVLSKDHVNTHWNMMSSRMAPTDIYERCLPQFIEEFFTGKPLTGECMIKIDPLNEE